MLATFGELLSDKHGCNSYRARDQCRRCMVLDECGGTHATLFLVEEFNSANKQAHELCGPIGDLRAGGCQTVAVRFRHVGRQQYINIVATVAELQGNIQYQQLLSCKSIILKSLI